MTDPQSNGKTGRPASLAMTLRQACRESGLYGDGSRCPVCRIRHLCQSDERWAVPLRDSAGSA